MSNINTVAISGNLVRDPELRATKSGSQVLGFTIASNESIRNRETGEWSEYANFIDVTVFGTRAESLSKILTKGMKVTVTGRLRYSSWEYQNRRYSKLEVIASEIDLPPRRYGAGVEAAPEAPVQIPTAPQPSDLYDEDIPF